MSGETEKGMYDSQKRHKIVTKMLVFFKGIAIVIYSRLRYDKGDY